MTVSVVDYGVGNLGSVINMFKRIGTEVRVVTSAEDVIGSERVLLPGVGAFDHGIQQLTDAGFTGAIRDFAKTGKPLMGICLGMQLLLDSSEEGDLPGLGLIPGESLRFESKPGLRVPHMGWNSIQPRHADGLIAGVETGSRFYFVHSYHAVPLHHEHTLATTVYGQDFASMIRAANVMGAQFHPEKSHAFGMAVLRNFSEL